MRMRLVLILVAALVLTVGVARAATTGASGRFCGAGRCVRIPAALATALAQRNDAFQPASAPRPAPFYRINIAATGEGYINRTILWVPSRKLWYLKEYVSPPLPGYRRTENAGLDPALARLARLVRPLRPTHWVLPK